LVISVVVATPALLSFPTRRSSDLRHRQAVWPRPGAGRDVRNADRGGDRRAARPGVRAGAGPWPGAADPAGHRRSGAGAAVYRARSEEHTSELQSRFELVCRLLLDI